MFNPSLQGDYEEFSFFKDDLESWRKHWVQISPRHDILAASAMSNNVKVQHFPTRKVKWERSAGFIVASVAFSPSGKYLAAVGDGPKVRLWDVETGEHLHDLGLRDVRAWDVCFSPDGRFLAAAGSDGEIKVWSVDTWEELFQEREHWAPISICFSPDGTELASASYDMYIGIWNAESGELVNKWIAGKADLSCVVYDPSGTRIVSASYDGTITIWDAHTHERLLVLRDHDEGPRALAFSGDGRTLYSGGDGLNVHVWDATPWDGSLERHPKKLEGFNSRVNALAIKPDGSELAAGGEDGIVKVYSLPSGEPRELRKHGKFGNVFDLAYEPIGPHILSVGSSDGRDIVAARWNTKTGMDAFSPVARSAAAVAVHPSGDLFVVGGFDEELNVYETQSGNRVGVGPLGRHDRQIGTMAFGPNGRHLVSASIDREIKLWDAQHLDEPQAGEILLNLQGSWAPQMAFDPAGRILAVGDGKYVLRYDMETRDPVDRLPGHGGSVNAIAYSHNGEFLASGSTDGTVKLWNAKTGDLLETLMVEGVVYRVAFTRNDEWLATAGEDTNVKLWNLSFLTTDNEAATSP